MSTGLPEEKARLRRSILAKTKKFPEDYIRESDAGIFAALSAMPEWTAARTLFIYVGVGREPDTRGLITLALTQGKRVCVPRCAGSGVMSAALVASPEELVPGRYGIPTPPGDAAELSQEEIDLAVIPGLCFDRRGFRLGRGAGYYDRWLCGYGGFSAGLCRRALLRDELPAEAHDARVRAVVTEAGTFYIKK